MMMRREGSITNVHYAPAYPPTSERQLNWRSTEVWNIIMGTNECDTHLVQLLIDWHPSWFERELKVIVSWLCAWPPPDAEHCSDDPERRGSDKRSSLQLLMQQQQQHHKEKDKVDKRAAAAAATTTTTTTTSKRWRCRRAFSQRRP